MSGLLAGIKVVSLTHYLQGPSCAQFLADLGADVVKIERVGGAYERHWSGAKAFLDNEVSVFFLMAGRNQRSVELNIQSDEGQAILWKLIEEADVLVENFRPGTLDKRGFSYEDVKRRNEKIIYCSLTGFGSEGPSREKPGQDLLLQSLSGLAMLSGRADDPPVLIGTALVDQHAATLGALGIVAALLGRARTAEGCKVDSNLLSAGLDLQIEPLNYHLNGAKLYDRSKSGISSRFHQAPYGVFKTLDSWLTLSLSDGSTLAAAFEDERFLSWSKEDQFDQREVINQRVADHMLRRTIKDWEEIFAQHGIWCARVNSYDDVLSDPQLVANQSILEFDDPVAGKARTLAHPIRYNGKAPGLRRPPPSVGQHTGEVLMELGFSVGEVEILRQKGAIGPDREVTVFDRRASTPTSSYSRKVRPAGVNG
jgi:crotonobetainyl-CoA:carnitine CoA-transferase CaiB-like acyl-CoA transferase